MDLNHPLIIFGGKGGVGKTTCSAAAAVHLASSGRKTLIVTSDLTPSLSDIFEAEIGDRERMLSDNLFALEVSQAQITRRWREKFGPDFYQVLSRLVDVEEIDREADYKLSDYIGSAPALKEETMLDLMVELAEGGGYDAIVWDTAPSGETLGLLDMPRVMKRHLTAGARLYQALDRLGRGKTSRSIADIMDEWIEASERIASLLQDYPKTQFIVVANPLGMVVSHTERLLATLRRFGMNVGGMVINRVVTEADSPFLKNMVEEQKEPLEELRRYSDGLSVVELPLFSAEVRGMARLREVAEILSAGGGDGKKG